MVFGLKIHTIIRSHVDHRRSTNDGGRSTKATGQDYKVRDGIDGVVNGNGEYYTGYGISEE